MKPLASSPQEVSPVTPCVKSFAQATNLLAWEMQVKPQYWTAFSGRIKHLLRLGLMPELCTGKGRSSPVTPEQMFHLAVAMRLTLAGIMPETVVEAMRANAGPLLKTTTDRVDVLVPSVFGQPAVKVQVAIPKIILEAVLVRVPCFCCEENVAPANCYLCEGSGTFIGRAAHLVGDGK